ncbi:MAG TPA: hypothetical protein VIJ79_03595 [Acidobacteriaceae bacterium]
MSNDQEQRRLQGLYAAMSDGELLRLAEGKAGLTAVAQQAIDAEMGARGLEMPLEETVEAVSAPEESDSLADPSLIELITFQVPVDAETAMRLLAEHDVPAHMEHAVRQVNEEGPKVKMNWLSLFVERARKEDAIVVLRKGMGLFPVMSADEIVDSEDGADDDENALLMVGNFQDAADAELAEKALTDAGIWFNAVKDTDETAEWEGTTIEVKMEDLERALEVVEEAFGAEE